VPDSLSETDVKDFLKHAENGFNDRDPRQIEQILGPHLIDHSELLGRMDIRQRIARVQEAMPDSTYTALDYLIEGHAVAWRWRIEGTHATEIMGKPPTGKRVTLRGLSVAVVKNGKLIEHWEFADLQDLFVQLEP
jgi:predicted ester cyclase